MRFGSSFRSICLVACVTDARLIDAHSFCWMLVRLKMPSLPEPVIPLPQVLTGLCALETDLAPAETNTENAFATVKEKDFIRRDAEHRRLGRLAQEIAMKSEVKRLREAGYPCPEKAVQPVWDQPGYGFDILSCERDGNPRHIEVKAAHQSGERVSFFVQSMSGNKILKRRTIAFIWSSMLIRSTRLSVLLRKEEFRRII